MLRFIMLFTLSVLYVSAVGAKDDVSGDKGSSFGNPAEGERTAIQVCAICHGSDGNSPLAMNPKLAGQHPQYLYKQLKDFQSGARSNAIMTGMVANLSDDDLRNVAAYYADQKPENAAAKDMDLVAIGQTLYRSGSADKGIAACSSCHAPDGAGLPPQYPNVSGQHAEYTALQLRAFRAGERNNDSNNMMRSIASRLSETEIKALAEYMSGLH